MPISIAENDWQNLAVNQCHLEFREKFRVTFFSFVDN